MTAYKRTLHDARDTLAFMNDLKSMDYPKRVAVRDGVDKKEEQNGLVHMWFKDIADWQGDKTPAEVKADCNLIYGRPIMARDDPEWEAVFGYLFNALSHAAKLKAVRVLDIPFTRLMGLKQLNEYMTQMAIDYREQGVPLTDPEARKYEAMQR